MIIMFLVLIRPRLIKRYYKDTFENSFDYAALFPKKIDSILIGILKLLLIISENDVISNVEKRIFSLNFSYSIWSQMRLVS